MGESLPLRPQNRKEEMTQTFSDKRVFVTGGASGIGRAIVIAFVERGRRPLSPGALSPVDILSGRRDRR